MIDPKNNRFASDRLRLNANFTASVMKIARAKLFPLAGGGGGIMNIGWP